MLTHVIQHIINFQSCLLLSLPNVNMVNKKRFHGNNKKTWKYLRKQWNLKNMLEMTLKICFNCARLSTKHSSIHLCTNVFHISCIQNNKYRLSNDDWQFHYEHFLLFFFIFSTIILRKSCSINNYLL